MSVSEDQLLDAFIQEMECHGDFARAWQAVQTRRDKRPIWYDCTSCLVLAPAPAYIPDPGLLQLYLPKDRKPTPEEIEEAWHKAQPIFVSEAQLLNVFIDAMESHGSFVRAWQAVMAKWDRRHYQDDIIACPMFPLAPVRIPDPKCLQKRLARCRKPTREELLAAWRECK